MFTAVHYFNAAIFQHAIRNTFLGPEKPANLTVNLHDAFAGSRLEQVELPFG